MIRSHGKNSPLMSFNVSLFPGLSFFSILLRNILAFGTYAQNIYFCNQLGTENEQWDLIEYYVFKMAKMDIILKGERHIHTHNKD